MLEITKSGDGRESDTELQPGGTPGTPSAQSCCWRSHWRGGRDPPLPLGWNLGVPRNRSKASPVVPREVQVSDYCKQINALKGTAENMVSNQQHLMSQDAVGSSHQ